MTTQSDRALLEAAKAAGIDVMKLARQAGNWKSPDYLHRFAALVIEECAKVCEERAGSVSMFATSREASTNNHAVRGCAAAIRALAGSPNEEKGAR